MKHPLISMMHRLLAYCPGSGFSLHPVPDLALSNGTTQSRYAPDKSTCSFTCEGKGFPLSAGWYVLSFHLMYAGDNSFDSVLYANNGCEAWSLPPYVAQGAHQYLIRFPFSVTHLRLDSVDPESGFTPCRLRLRRVGRLEAAWRMWRVVRRGLPASEGHVTQVFYTKLWQCLKGRLSRRQCGQWLRSQYMKNIGHDASYKRWLTLYDPGKVQAQRKDCPLVSILLPVYNTPETFLRCCLDSVLAQTWKHWELCVADDASTNPELRKVLQEYAARDTRIRVTWRAHNGHISAASNSALELARGEYVALLDHDDELHPAALTIVMDAWAHHPSWRMVYTDEDKIDEEGQRYDPYFKPDLNEELFLGQNFICHLMVYQRQLLRESGGFREGLEGSQDWDLALRCCERLSADQIGHVPVVLYHWRAIAGSTALDPQEKGYIHAAGRRALSDCLARRQERAEVLDVEGLPNMFRIRHTLPDPVPKVSIIIPTRDKVHLLRQCVDSILQRSTYPDYEIVVVDNQSSETQTLECLAAYGRDPRMRVLRNNGSFNYSRINNEAVASCRGELICLLNNDTQVITPDWLEELVSHALRPRVGAVGAMLYYSNNTIQHAGVVIGLHGVAAHLYHGKPRGFTGPFGRARLTQSVTAVTGACLLVRREIYWDVGGLDESLKVAFNDVDFCLRLRERGYRNVWTPFAELYHFESLSRGYEDTVEKRQRFAAESRLMTERWGHLMENDPAYNPNLSLCDEPFSLAFSPRPWRREIFERSSRAWRE